MRNAWPRVRLSVVSGSLSTASASSSVSLSSRTASQKIVPRAGSSMMQPLGAVSVAGVGVISELSVGVARDEKWPGEGLLVGAVASSMGESMRA